MTDSPSSDTQSVDPQVFKDLQSVEESFNSAELQLLHHQIKLYTPIYQKRDPLLLKIPRFWITVIEETQVLEELFNLEDTKLLDHLLSLSLTRPNPKEPRDFTLHFQFSENAYLQPNSLKLSKEFKKSADQSNSESEYTSTPVKVSWSSDITSQSANSRPSFFTFFAWTGKGEGGEGDVFEQGEEVALVLSEEVYPDALKIWTDAQALGDEEGSDESDGSVDIQSGPDDDDDDDDDDEEKAEDAEGRKKKKVRTG